MATAVSIEGLDAIRQAQEKRRMDQEVIRYRWQLAKQTVWLSLLAGSFLKVGDAAVPAD